MDRPALALTPAEAAVLRGLPLELDEFWGGPTGVPGELHSNIARSFARHLQQRALATIEIPAPGRFIVRITENGMQALALSAALREED